MPLPFWACIKSHCSWLTCEGIKSLSLHWFWFQFLLSSLLLALLVMLIKSSWPLLLLTLAPTTLCTWAVPLCTAHSFLGLSLHLHLPLQCPVLPQQKHWSSPKTSTLLWEAGFCHLCDILLIVVWVGILLAFIIVLMLLSLLLLLLLFFPIIIPVMIV